LAPKIGVQVMPKGRVPKLKSFCVKGYACIGVENNGHLCAIGDYIYVYQSLALLIYGCWRAMHDMFIVVINFISNNREVKHVTIGLFEVNETNGMAMASKLITTF
jgi:hypothetical protein